MNKYEYFLEYNKDGIFKNLLQAEDHLKRVSNPGFAQCVVKHLSFCEGESEEGVAHALHIDKKNVENYKDLSRKIFEIRVALQKGEIKPNEAILKVREARKFFESFNKEFDISKCQACSMSKTEFLEKAKALLAKNSLISSKSITKGENKMALGEKAVVLGGQFAGLGVKEAGQYIDGFLGMVGQPAWKKASTYIDLIGGVGLMLAPLKFRMSRNMELGMAIIGSQRIADKSFELGKQFIAPAAVRAIAPMAAPRIIGAPAVGLVRVD